jgi:hypothetical protein
MSIKGGLWRGISKRGMGKGEVIRGSKRIKVYYIYDYEDSVMKSTNYLSS